jgi:hypothetical protein
VTPTQADLFGSPQEAAPSYTVFWTNDYCRQLRKAGDLGKLLQVVFGGSHQSQPSLTKFGVRPGNWVYPIRVEKGQLFIVAGMQVQRFVSVSEYVSDILRLPEAYSALHTFELVDRLKAEHPEWGHLLPWGCLVEVAEGHSGASIRLDRAVPTDVVEQLRFVSRRGERPIKHLEAGVIKSSMGLQGGVYRLSSASAMEFARLLAALP